MGHETAGRGQLLNHWLKYKIRSVEEAWNAEKHNESPYSSSKGSESNFARQAERKMKKVKGQRETGQHMDLNKEKEYQADGG